MSPKDVARQWFERVWNQKDQPAIHQLMHREAPGHTEGGVVAGPDVFQAQMFAPLTMAFPDLRLTIDAIISEGDDVVIRWTAAATHVGNLLGIAATHRKVSFSGMTWLRCRDGQIVEGWDRWNFNGLLALLTTGTEAVTAKFAPV